MKKTSKLNRVKAALERTASSLPASLAAGASLLMDFGNILVPVDFSKPSKAALEQAIALAAQLNGRVHVLVVVENPVFHDFTAFPLTVPDAEIVANAERELRGLLQSIGPTAVPIDPQVCTGIPWQKIADFAARNKISLIIIPTHGYTGLKHALLGSTTERVVRQAPCPVLVLRADPAHIISKQSTAERSVYESKTRSQTGPRHHGSRRSRRAASGKSRS